MSQPELVARLRSARPVAPPELRERVRMLAADAAVPPRRRITWRRALVIAVPVAAAVAAAVVLLPRGGGGGSAAPAPPVEQAVANTAVTGAAAGSVATAPKTALAPSSDAYRALPAPSATRPQRYVASIELRLRDAAAVSAASRRATAIVAALGGYPSSLNVDAAGRSGYANLVFRVPRARVQTAVGRLSSLGAIVGENVRIQDLGGQVSTTDRKIVRLQKRRAELKAVDPQTTETGRQIAALTAQIQRLRRAKAATLRTASYATVSVELTTPGSPPPVAKHERGPLHGLAVAFRWLGIGAVYALALGAPLIVALAVVWLLVRTVRRRREEHLLETN